MTITPDIEADRHAELRDRLDHLRATAAARSRIVAFIHATEAYATEAYAANVFGDQLHLDDLRSLLNAEFDPDMAAADRARQAQP